MSKIKRLLAPKFWKVPKKQAKFVVAPRPGPHKKFESIPWQIVLRDILKLADPGKEARTIINRGEILVDGKIRKDHAYPVGLFDSITIPKTKKFYRLVPTAKGLELMGIPEKESNLKICKINNKTILKKGKLQLNLHDGRNLLVEKDIYKNGDSILIELPNKIVKHVKYEPNNLVIVIKGKNSGKTGKIKSIEAKKTICEIDRSIFELRKDQLAIIGEDKPLISVSR